ncbi:hypothetical protein H1O16_gp057 [Burkholderia phage BcepSaruman]|uniref:Uncharacterized protein n=1 Tax=Burkholderia phage BcepSaruman TaxID=2530032 RepID=A0A4D5ZCT3_9CAUD|nr:hypothetical protein H1O16_gp057 [Burkholderia phage BcepSaruman]QBX06470.1 hypothetical protein BcepSaruman_057 [Burkholderia phage BcepSaruman]
MQQVYVMRQKHEGATRYRLRVVAQGPAQFVGEGEQKTGRAHARVWESGRDAAQHARTAGYTLLQANSAADICAAYSGVHDIDACPSGAGWVRLGGGRAVPVSERLSMIRARLGMMDNE